MKLVPGLPCTIIIIMSYQKIDQSRFSNILQVQMKGY